MESVKSLLAVYAGVLVINVAVSAMLWSRNRTPLHRALFSIWAAFLAALFVQGGLSQGNLAITLGYSSLFFLTIFLSRLQTTLVGISFNARPFAIGLLVSLLFCVCFSIYGAPFWLISLPVCLAVALPLLHTGVRVLMTERNLSVTMKVLVGTSFASALHTLDFPFLRDKPEAAPAGFAIALLIVFALSISANAVVIEAEASGRSRVEDLNRFQRQFFANVTHELRTPLTMILAPVESLQHGEAGPLSISQRSYIDTVWRNGVRLLKLINDLLDLAKADEGFLRIRPEKTDLRVFAEDVVAFARPMAARKGLRLDLEVKTVSGDVHIDPERFERVLVNLVANALKFTEQGGVKVILDGDEREARIVVEDTGIGIESNQLERIFQRFTQADTSTTRRYGGTGIGLAFAKQIVELHGGRISVNSVLGAGSRFTVHLQRGSSHFGDGILDRRSIDRDQDAPGKRSEDLEPREWAQHIERHQAYRFGEIGEVTDRRRVPRGIDDEAGTRVLVVEDNLEVLELVHLTLHTDHAIMVAQDGKQGLELALRLRPDLIVTDFMMPEMDGLALIKELRARSETAETPIVMLTAKNTVDDRLSVREAGADVYLAKPFSPRELSAAVRGLLEKRGRLVGRIMRAQVDSLESISAGLAHEIHNPLNFLKNAHHLIVENLGRIGPLVASGRTLSEDEREIVIKSRDKIDRVVGAADHGVQRIERIVDLVRRYAREGYPNQLEDMAFDEAVSDVVALIGPVGKGECEVISELGAKDARVLCLPEEMQQVFRCLIQNGLDAAGPGGHVWVRTRCEAREIVMDVVDDGPGVPPEMRTRIFSPFFTTKAAGMGLGLAIATRVVVQARGKIELASGPGEPTRFRIRIPEASTMRPLATGARAPGQPEARA